MSEQSRRKELVSQYKQTRPEAGVYRIANRQTGKALLGSTTNLSSVRSKLEFAQSTHTLSVLDQRLLADARQYGVDAFSFEVMEVLDVKPEATQAEVLADLAILEGLWREKASQSSSIKEI